MKTRVSRKQNHKSYSNSLYWGIGICFLLLIGCELAKHYPSWIEKYYSQGFYSYFSYVPKVLFGWLPFSFGDLFYVAVVVFIVLLCLQLLREVWRRHFKAAWHYLLKLTLTVLSLYLFFYFSWGLNYYRIPMVHHLDLQVDALKKSDYLFVLDKYIDRCNSLRNGIVPEQLDKGKAKMELQALMQQDTDLSPILSHTQVQAKSPLSSTLVSYFTVTGYFNPFTHEVQVNEKMPIVSYPFTVVHELGHQMGIGFEDECNFAAFLKLVDHPEPWYRYAAAYETVQYLLRNLRAEDEALFKIYYKKLSPLVLADIATERAFWKKYSGWVEGLTSYLYSGYLQHNNQPEGIERYSMMSRMVVAWEVQQKAKKKL
ncbi:DUF3810 domain-containing protein [Sphingobacterium psychroaquaticum]|uniref:DUF3810 domain-containing protein n=1 Tax=Sphingobacterium psychroaquaticum TaxID=561061 RepID=UPI00141BB307|nr:DUF3810 domain-containing protein [Sphingobacterium psychroaquaticum]